MLQERSPFVRVMLACWLMVVLPQVAPAQEEDDRPQFDLSLLQAIELALRHNLSVQVNRYDQDISYENIDAQRGPFDPMLTFRLPQTFQRRTAPATTQTEGADIVTEESFAGGLTFSEKLEWGTSWQVNWSADRGVTNNQFSLNNPTLGSSLSLSVSQPLLQGFGDVNRTQILVAKNSYEGSLESFRAQAESTLLQTYEAYWGLVGQVERVKVRQEALQLAQNQLNRNEMQMEIGTLAPIETVQSRRQVENARLTLIQQQNTLANQADELKRLLNLAAVRPDALEIGIRPTSEPEYSTAPINVEAAIATALEKDPQIRQLQLGLESDRLNLRAARNAQLPQVDLSAGVMLRGRSGDRLIRGPGDSISEIQQAGFAQALAQVLSGDFNTWNVGITVRLPIHNYAADTSFAQSSIRERQRLVSLEERRQEVVFSVRRTVRDFESGVRQVETARITSELSALQLLAAERKFQVGTSTNFEVLQIQDQLSNARLNEILAVTNLLVSRARFEYAKGTLLEFFGVSIQEAGAGRR